MRRMPYAPECAWRPADQRVAERRALPTGDGKVPGLTSEHLDWSAVDIAEYLKSGFTPEYDVVGGEMAEVVENTSQLTDADRAAIAAYIKALP